MPDRHCTRDIAERLGGASASNLELERARLDERAKLARDLHDQAGQQISAVKLWLIKLRNEVDAKNIRKKITQIVDLVDDLDRNLHRTIHDLQPVGLDELGIVSTLRNMTEEWGLATGIAISFVVEGAQPAPRREVDVAIFRIIQECLTNIHKHAAGASIVIVKMTFSMDRVEVTIDDNGVGIADRKQLNSGESYHGIDGMLERAALLRGRVEVGRSPSSGTRIYASIPWG